MKLYYFNFVRRVYKVAVLLMASLFLLSRCGHDEPSELETDKVRKLLTSTTWKVQTVTIDETDKTSQYSALTLKFSDTRYTTTNGNVVWPPSGVWTFGDETGKLIIRGDDLEMTLQEITSTKLVLQFVWAKTTLGSGRSSSLSGEHVFTFVK